MANVIFIALILLSIYAFISKNENYIYIFMFLYPILPEYFALSLGASLPILTGSRCLILLLFFFTLLKYKKINFKAIKDTKFLKVILIYFIFSTANFVVHNSNSENVKDYIGMIIENIIFVFFVCMNIDTEQKKEKCIKMLVYASGVVGVLAMLEPLAGINIAEFLDTGASDSVLKISYVRLGMYRATFSFGHPICLAVYCIMIMPITMYCIQKYNKIIFKIIFCINIITVFLTISRGQILIGVVLLIMIFITMKKDEKRKYYSLIFVAGVAIILATLFSQKLMNNFQSIIYSVLNTFGLNLEVEDFGENANALGRLDQLSMLGQVLDKYPLFGGGEEYIRRNPVYITRADGTTFVAVSVDCEYISMLLNKGILGFLVNIYMYIFILKLHLKSKNKTLLSRALYFSALGAMMCYVTVNQLTTNRIFWVIICLTIIEAFQSKKAKEEEELKKLKEVGKAEENIE